jgi:hypothetical protein
MDAVVVKASVAQRPVVNLTVNAFASVANAPADFGKFGTWYVDSGGGYINANSQQTNLNGETTWQIGASALPGGLRNSQVLFDLDGVYVDQPNGLRNNAGSDPSLIYEVNWQHYEQP